MNTLLPAPAELERLLCEILAELGATTTPVAPGRLKELTEVLGAARPAPATELCVAEYELDRVHHSELAFLLREGARRCELWDAQECERWRALLDEALATAGSDGLELGCELVVRRASPGSERPWTLDAVDLARASLRCAEHPLGRLELARALQRRGEPGAASGVLAAALHGLAAIPGVLGARPWPDLIRGLARAQESAGHPGRARELRRWLGGRVA